MIFVKCGAILTRTQDKNIPHEDNGSMSHQNLKKNLTVQKNPKMPFGQVCKKNRWWIWGIISLTYHGK